MHLHCYVWQRETVLAPFKNKKQGLTLYQHFTFTGDENQHVKHKESDLHRPLYRVNTETQKDEGTWLTQSRTRMNQPNTGLLTNLLSSTGSPNAAGTLVPFRKHKHEHTLHAGPHATPGSLHCTKLIEKHSRL